MEGDRRRRDPDGGVPRRRCRSSARRSRIPRSAWGCRRRATATPAAGHVDVIGDIIESANLVIRSPRTASVVLGGGTPKNFINQASVQAEFYDDRVGGHRYALQIVTDVPHFGGASGSSLEEAQSWGKLATDAEQVTVHADVTIALPLLVSALAAQRARHAGRPEAAALRPFGSASWPSTDGPCRRRASRHAIDEFSVRVRPRRAARVRRRAAASRARSTTRASVILPVPVDRTTSYVGGTRNGPREILQASSHMELWDEELGVDVHGRHLHAAGDGAAVRRAGAADGGDPRRRGEILRRDKFLVTLGGEHSITPPLVAAAAARYPGLGVLQIDAHADLRDCYMGTRTTTRARCAGRSNTPRSRRSASAACRPRKPRRPRRSSTTIFYDDSMRRDPAWIDAGRRDAAGDGLHHDRRRRPGPGDHAGDRHAGAGRPVLVRDARAAPRHHRAPQRSSPATSSSSARCPGMMAPNFLCAKLVYKILTYRFARGTRLANDATEPSAAQTYGLRLPLRPACIPVCILVAAVMADLYERAVEALEQGHGAEAVVPPGPRPQAARPAPRRPDPDPLRAGRGLAAAGRPPAGDRGAGRPPDARERPTRPGCPTSGACTAGSPPRAASRPAASRS